MLASETAPWFPGVYAAGPVDRLPSNCAHIPTYSRILIIDAGEEYMNIHRYLEVCIEIVYSVLDSSKVFSIGFKQQQKWNKI